MIDWNKCIRDIQDYPKPGILFKDITPLLKDPQAMREVVEQLAKPFINANITAVAGLEARGFIFGPLVAQALNCAFVPVRKPGKLPFDTISKSYDLEYGQATIELHTDAVSKDDKVLVVDDLLATGGTLKAACELIEKLGASITACACVVELGFLNGRQALTGYDVHCLHEFK